SEPGRCALQAETVDEFGGDGRQQYPAERKAGRRNGERDGAAPFKQSGNQRRSGNKRSPRVTDAEEDVESVKLPKLIDIPGDEGGDGAHDCTRRDNQARIVPVDERRHAKSGDTRRDEETGGCT